MVGTRPRRASARRRRPRILLVGLTPLLMDVLSGPLSDAADASAVPFPGDAFEQAADRFKPDMVLVDVTYLDEALVRPLMLQRFAELRPVIAFVSEQGTAWFDDLRNDVGGRLEHVDAAALLGLVARPNLTIVR